MFMIEREFDLEFIVVVVFIVERCEENVRFIWYIWDFFG